MIAGAKGYVAGATKWVSALERLWRCAQACDSLKERKKVLGEEKDYILCTAYSIISGTLKEQHLNTF